MSAAACFPAAMSVAHCFATSVTCPPRPPRSEPYLSASLPLSVTGDFVSAGSTECLRGDGLVDRSPPVREGESALPLEEGLGTGSEANRLLDELADAGLAIGFVAGFTLRNSG